MSGESKGDLKQLHADNDKKAAAESAIIKAGMRRALERILQRMKERGETPQSTTVDDLLREDMP